MIKIDEFYLENLHEFVFDEKRIVTYKYFAATLGVHVNISKQMLYTFYTQEKQKEREIYATYFLSGFAPANTFGNKKLASKDEENGEERGIHNEHFILLCGCDKLEETKNKFTQLLSVHIYAVSPKPVEDFQDLKFVSSDQVRKVFKSQSADEYLNQDRSPQKHSTDNEKEAPLPEKKPIVVENKKDEVKQPQRTLFSNTDSISKNAKKTSKPPAKSKGKAGPPQQKLSFKPDSTDKFTIKPPALSPKRKQENLKASPKSLTCIEMDSDEEEEEEEEDSEDEEVTVSRKRIRKPSPKRNKKSQPPRKSKVIVSDSEDESDSSATSPSPKRRSNGKASPPRRKSKIIESDSDEDIKKALSLMKQENSGRKRVAKMITSTFTDEDGYVVTKNEKVYVSEPEDGEAPVKMEIEEEPGTSVKKENTSPKTKSKSGDVIPPKTISNGVPKKERKSASQPKGKQQSIMNFFQRK